MSRVMKHNISLFPVPFLILTLTFMGCQKTSDSHSAPPLPPIPESTRLDAKGSGVHQQTVKTPDGEQLRYTISVPAGYDGKTPVPVVMALHYAGDVTPFYGGAML